MALLKRTGPAIEGRWYTYGTDGDTGADVKFLIRAIPDRDEKQIDVEHYGPKRDRITESSTREALVKKATLALIDSEGFEAVVTDPAAWSKVLGKPATEGETLVLDGLIRAEKVRAYVLRESLELTDLPAWIVRTAATLQAMGRKVEEELGKI